MKPAGFKPDISAMKMDAEWIDQVDR